jgi:hypothetical protein
MKSIGRVFVIALACILASSAHAAENEKLPVGKAALTSPAVSISVSAAGRRWR